MDATTKASRAVLAEFARKALRPYEIAGVSLFISGIIGASLLITFLSAWWWLLMIVMIGYGIIGSLAWLVFHYTLDKVNPPQTDEQKRAVRQFVTKVSTLADTIGLTRFALIARIISDVMARKQQNVLSEFAHDSSSLKDDFLELISLFQ